jgi:sulfur carrier protein
VTVHINGEPREVPDGLTVAQLLELLGVEPVGVAVEVNEHLIRKAGHAARTLAAHDQIEIVTFVGGG